MKYIYNGIESNDESVIDQAIWDKLSEENKFPTEESLAEEWNMHVEIEEESK